MPALTSLAIGGAALAGGVAGAIPTETTATSGTNLSKASVFEKMLKGQQQGDFNQMRSFVNAGPGQADYTAGVQSSRDLASMLQALSQSGGIPGQQDISQANQFASDIFKAREMQMSQMFQDQMNQSNAQLAASGRDINDPVMRARLFQEQGRQQSLLGAERQGFAAQYAQNLPMQRLQFASQRSDVMNQIGNQAMQNRASLFGIGQQALNNERNWRLQTGTRWGSQESGGGLGGAITGALGGAGVGAGIANMFGGGGVKSPVGGMGGGGAIPGAMSAPVSPMMGGMPSGVGMMSGPQPYGGQTSIFQAFPNFPGAGVGTGPFPAYGPMGARRAY